MYDLFIYLQNERIFDDFNNYISDLGPVWGGKLAKSCQIGTERWFRHSGWALPERILIPLLTNQQLPSGRITMIRTLQESQETKKDIWSVPVLLRDSKGRFINWYAGISSIVAKHPEYNAQALLSACEEQTKCYGKHWSWDLMLPVRIEFWRALRNKA